MDLCHDDKRNGEVIELSQLAVERGGCFGRLKALCLAPIGKCAVRCGEVRVNVRLQRGCANPRRNLESGQRDIDRTLGLHRAVEIRRDSRTRGTRPRGGPDPAPRRGCARCARARLRAGPTVRAPPQSYWSPAQSRWLPPCGREACRSLAQRAPAPQKPARARPIRRPCRYPHCEMRRALTLDRGEPLRYARPNPRALPVHADTRPSPPHDRPPASGVCRPCGQRARCQRSPARSGTRCRRFRSAPMPRRVRLRSASRSASVSCTEILTPSSSLVSCNTSRARR